MKRVLLVGSHLGHNLEYFVKTALEKLGHSVTFFGYRSVVGSLSTAVRMAITRSNIIRRLAEPSLLKKVNVQLRQEASSSEPDLLLSIKGEAVLASTITWFRRELGSRTALWYPDDPRYFDSFVRHVAPCYDHVFTASPNVVGIYESIGVRNVSYLPFACEPSVHRKVTLSHEERKQYGSDICFIGTYSLRRSGLLRSLNGFDLSVYGPYWRFFRRGANRGLYGPEMVKAFNGAKICLNIHEKSDLEYKANMRIFEATGSGSFVLTDKPHALEELYKPNLEVACYNNEHDLAKLVKYYLDNEEERTMIAIRGQERAYREHTYTRRMEALLRKLM